MHSGAIHPARNGMSTKKNDKLFGKKLRMDLNITARGD